MAVYLLDVNVLVALAWSNHVHHAAVRAGFDVRAPRGWATCPITQAGFVRISSNPKAVQASLTPAEAANTLARMVAHPQHDFWPDSLTVVDALSAGPVQGYRQVTDAYLAALAKDRNGKLATLDRAVAAMGPHVELLS